MKLPYSCKIDECCSKDETRGRIMHPYIDTNESPVIVATDGRRIAVLPVQLEDGDCGGVVPVGAMRVARQIARDELEATTPREMEYGEEPPSPDTIELVLGGSTIGVGGFKIDRHPVDFPKWREAVAATKPPRFRISLNADLLAGLQHALGTSAVVLEISADKDPMRVVPYSCRGDAPFMPGAFGVLMPVRAEGTGDVQP